MDLRIENLSVRRGWRSIFTGLGLTLEPGGAVLLRGPNGAGKSTLLRCLAGFISPDDGDAVLGGVSLQRDRAEFTSRLVYTGHLDALKPAFTARETLAFHAALHGAPASRADAALDAMALGHLAEQPVRILSAGQKRRLGLARLALMEKPLWMLDEPTVSLDADSAERVAALARAHCERGGMVIAATHIDLAIPGAAILNPGDFTPETTPDGPLPEDAALSGESW